jgi:type VI secretion system protein ImpK
LGDQGLAMNNNFTDSNSDKTLIIPTPGGAKPRTNNVVQPNQMADNNFEPLSVHCGLSQLVNNAANLLSVIIKLRTTVNHNDFKSLHRNLCDEIKAFTIRCGQQGIDQRQVLSAQYVLCSTLDEAVLKTPWGATCGWANHSLLSIFHNETFGGEKYFDILKQVIVTPSQNVDLLELFYYTLSLGFEGKFRIEQRGADQLQHIRDNLRQTIERQRPPQQEELSGHWQSSYKAKNSLLNRTPIWVISCVATAVLILSFSGFQYWLHQDTEQSKQHIDSLLTSSLDNNEH